MQIKYEHRITVECCNNDTFFKLLDKVTDRATYKSHISGYGHISGYSHNFSTLTITWMENSLGKPMDSIEDLLNYHDIYRDRKFYNIHIAFFNKIHVIYNSTDAGSCGEVYYTRVKNEDPSKDKKYVYLWRIGYSPSDTLEEIKNRIHKAMSTDSGNADALCHVDRDIDVAEMFFELYEPSMDKTKLNELLSQLSKIDTKTLNEIIEFLKTIIKQRG